MVSLKQITSVTVTSPWSAYDASKGQTGRGSVVSPTYPIFIFDYQESEYIAVGYVVGTTAGTLFSQADANFLTVPAFYFYPFGYNAWIGGGGICAVSSCMQNGSSQCGPWWAIVNLSNNTLNTYCIGIIPQNLVTGHLFAVLADLVNNYILLITSGGNGYSIVVWVTPISSISTLLNNQAPSNMEWVWVQSSEGSNIMVYESSPTIYNGNLVYPGVQVGVTNTSPGPMYVWVTPLSTLYSNLNTGVPSTSSSPLTVGTVYTLSNTTAQEGGVATVFATASSSGLTYNVAIMQIETSTTVLLWILNPSNWSVTNSNSFTLPATTLNFMKATWNSVYLIPAWSSSSVYVIVIDPKTMSMEYTSVTGAYAMASSEGYFVVASQPLNNSSVTFTVYQVLLDHTYVFQNVSITISGSTVTATGTLFDETTNSAVAGATVYLVAVRSFGDQYSDDVIIINSGTTNNNGQFSISGTVQAGYNYYGVLYVP